MGEPFWRKAAPFPNLPQAFWLAGRAEGVPPGRGGFPQGFGKARFPFSFSGAETRVMR